MHPTGDDNNNDTVTANDDAPSANGDSAAHKATNGSGTTGARDPVDMNAISSVAPSYTAIQDRTGNRGAPRMYTADIAKRLCTMLATSTLTLRQVCDELHLQMGTVMSWLARYPDFAEGYAKAREYQCELRADEMLDIADNSTNDWVDYETKSGRVVRQFDYEHSRRSELRIKTRQWLMEKYGRRRFGDRLEVSQTLEVKGVASLAEPERVEDAVSLIRRVRERLAAAEADGELIDESADSAQD